MTAGALPVWTSAAATFSATATGVHLVAVPAHSDGDLLLLVAHSRASNNDGSVSGLSAGWTQHGGAGNIYGTGISRVALGWIKGDGIVSSLAATFGGTGTVRFQARVHRFTGADGFGPTPIEGAVVTAGTGATVSMPTVTPPGLRRLACAVTAASVTTPMAAAAGETGGDWTEPTAEHQSSNGTIGLQVSPQDAGGQISGGTFAITSANWVSVGFSIAPADVALEDAGLPAGVSILDLSEASVLISDQDVAVTTIADN